MLFLALASLMQATVSRPAVDGNKTPAGLLITGRGLVFCRYPQRTTANRPAGTAAEARAARAAAAAADADGQKQRRARDSESTKGQTAGQGDGASQSGREQDETRNATANIKTPVIMRSGREAATRRRAALFALRWRAGVCQGCAAPRRGLALTVARSPAIPAAAGVPPRPSRAPCAVGSKSPQGVATFARGV